MLGCQSITLPSTEQIVCVYKMAENEVESSVCYHIVGGV